MGANEEKAKSVWDGYRALSKMRWLAFGFTMLAMLASSIGILPIWACYICFAALNITVFLGCVFECPCCHKGYFRSWGFWDPFAEVCRSCGLPKWAEPPYPARKPPSLPRYPPPPDPRIALRKIQLNFLTLVLRDDPGVIGLKPDRDGWVEIEDLLKRAKRNKIALEREDLNAFLIEKEGGFLEIGGFKNLVRYVEG